MKIINKEELEENFFKYKETEDIITVKEIINEVRKKGDIALKQYTLKYDNVSLDYIKVHITRIKEAYQKVDPSVVTAINRISSNIKKFAEIQLEQFKSFTFEIQPGVFLTQKVVPIERTGVYVPGGKNPLVSTLLMCAIPAKVAGVNDICVCSPPSYLGSIHPAILVAADIVGVDEVYQIGGVQAIAAMAYGTETIKKVDKIVGPGNKYVVAAKKEVFGSVGIDFIAGPTEIFIIADEYSNPNYIAADLMAQSEHNGDALPVLITPYIKVAERVKNAIEVQLQNLTQKDVIADTISKNGLIILVKDIDEAIEITNKKAPEHIELFVQNPEIYIDKLKNYGSLFIGEYSTSVLCDYSSGLNHILPTQTTARYTGGLSVKDFIKLQTTLLVTKDGLSRIGEDAISLAKIERLNAHIKAVEIRLQT